MDARGAMRPTTPGLADLCAAFFIAATLLKKFCKEKLTVSI